MTTPTKLLDVDERARALGPRRDELLDRLPRAIRSARDLSHSEREFVVDDAITYTVVDYHEPIGSLAELERVFWTACDLRVKGTLNGRHNTVRGGYERVSADHAERVRDADADVVAAIERAEEIGVLRELLEVLPDDERRVLQVKFGSGTAEPLGYKRIAQALGITVAAARAADRSLKRRIDHFAALVTAGRLCPTREVALEALAHGIADPTQQRVARAHIAHCQHCKLTYASQQRAIESGALERKLASLLPPLAVDQRGRLRGAWDAIVETATRPFTHEGAATAAQLASSGVGRGAGTIAMLKLAGACMASAGALGVCATTIVVPALAPDPPATTAPKTVTKRAPEGPVGRHDRIPSRAEQHLTPTPTPSPKPTKGRSTRESAGSAATTQGGTGPTDHEATPASPAPSNAAPGGESEFDPTYSPSSPPQPAPVPAAPGGSEFF